MVSIAIHYIFEYKTSYKDMLKAYTRITNKTIINEHDIEDIGLNTEYDTSLMGVDINCDKITTVVKHNRWKVLFNIDKEELKTLHNRSDITFSILVNGITMYFKYTRLVVINKTEQGYMIDMIMEHPKNLISGLYFRDEEDDDRSKVLTIIENIPVDLFMSQYFMLQVLLKKVLYLHEKNLNNIVRYGQITIPLTFMPVKTTYLLIDSVYYAVQKKTAYLYDIRFGILCEGIIRKECRYRGKTANVKYAIKQLREGNKLYKPHLNIGKHYDKNITDLIDKGLYYLLEEVYLHPVSNSLECVLIRRDKHDYDTITLTITDSAKEWLPITNDTNTSNNNLKINNVIWRQMI